MDSLADDFADGTFSDASPPCLSLYQPTHRSHPARRQDPIRFENLVRSLGASLEQKYSRRDIAPLLEPFHSLASDTMFWNHTLDGLAVLRAQGVFRVYRLQRPVPERAVVADSFHVKPLIRILQSADRYQVLGLSLKGVRLFDGNRDVLDEVELETTLGETIAAAATEAQEREGHIRTLANGSGATAGVQWGVGSKGEDKARERFFRTVDRLILEHHSQPAGVPLLLAALPEHHHAFRRVTRNGFLLEDGLDVHPDALSLTELRERAWRAIEPHYLTRLAGLVEMFGSARARELGTGDPADAAYNAVAGRVATLLVDADRHLPARIDPETGFIETDDLSDPATDDLLDDIAEWVLRHRGQVVVVPSDRMPTDSGVAAIYRY